jgi:OmpA-OmpF porin, OOP family
MYKIWTIVGAGALLAAGPVLAQDDDNTDGFYLGAGIGEFSTDINEISDVDDVDLDFDTDEDATKIYAGWRFNRFFAVQLDQYDFGESTLAVNLLPVSTETEGTAASIVGTLPIGPIELFARAGMIWYDVNVNFDGEDVIDESGNDNVLAAGIGFTVAKRLNIKLEYEEIQLDNAVDDANAVWLSANWRF